MRHVKTGAELMAALGEGSELLKEDMVSVMQKITMDSFDMLIRRSAKDTGFLRSNWSVSVDTPAPETELHNPDSGAHADAKLPPLQIEYNSVIQLYNNTEYAIYLEQGTPIMWSQPMIRPTVMAANQQFDYAYQILSKKKYNV